MAFCCEIALSWKSLNGDTDLGIGWDNDLLAHGIKPLPETMLTSSVGSHGIHLQCIYYL